MRGIKRLNSLFWGVTVLFVLTVMMPTEVEAHWKYKSVDNVSTTQCNNYSDKAKSYLKKYYKTYNYKYYKCYLYYVKKHNRCKKTVPSSSQCSKYKDLADKYLAAYNRCGYSCYYRYYKYYKSKYEKCQESSNPTGSLCGFVFEDSNDNGEYDKDSDNPLTDVEVKIEDSKGNTVTVKTSKWGYYSAKNIPVGTATVTIVESSLPDNASQVLGTNPTDVEIEANKSAWEERNGYIFAEKTGTIKGFIFEDSNDDGKYRKDDDKPLSNVEVTITDSDGKVTVVKTGTNGYYIAKNILVGTVSVDINEDTLPDNLDKKIAVGTDPTEKTVKANKSTWEECNGYKPANEPKFGSITGLVFYDKDSSHDYNTNDIPLAGIKVNILDADGTVIKTVVTDADGKYLATDIPVGDVTVDIDESLFPDYIKHTIFVGTDPTEVTVLSGETVEEENNGYIGVVWTP